jgi:hypothetical protein
MSTVTDSDNEILIDRKKLILQDIYNDEKPIPIAYRQLCQLEEQTPDFFKKGRLFDIFVEPPTEKLENWTIAVFASRLGLNMLRLGINNNRNLEGKIQQRSNSTYLFDGSDGEYVYMGFLNQLLHQESRNVKIGSAIKTVNVPYSQEMMDYVLEAVDDFLTEVTNEAQDYLANFIRFASINQERYT